jgi:hypothetical protein
MQQEAKDGGCDVLVSNSRGPVGYKKPPLHSRFKKGRSGNRRGRPRGRQSLAKVVSKIFDTRISVRIDGETVKLSLLEALVYVHRVRALRGDAKSQRAFALIMDALGYFDEKVEDERPHGVLVLHGPYPQSDDEWLFQVHRSDQLKCEREDKVREAERLAKGEFTQMH